jgi:hypothetical protein
MEVFECLHALDADYNAVVNAMDFPGFVEHLSGPQPCHGDPPNADAESR